MAFGEQEEVALSKIGRADKEVKIWEEVLRAHEEGLPRLAPMVQLFLYRAKEKRAVLEDTENQRVGLVDSITLPSNERRKTEGQNEILIQQNRGSRSDSKYWNGPSAHLDSSPKERTLLARLQGTRTARSNAQNDTLSSRPGRSSTPRQPIEILSGTKQSA
jgi:hypothetical protein